eukprot:CAMPEP_0195654776 /NCGR_PEP_ID=MMETSP0815-20121206/34095_1 /TAXON_ID=97485 /ORGANISM="Prymnesium parvum, Strain Texoma1" /LENGTH=80 /DNA_ID=CAMNT_0040798999 /DNA_START=716 /DNA_END=958 /DNA_ORIENTATION=-
MSEAASTVSIHEIMVFGVLRKILPLFLVTRAEAEGVRGVHVHLPNKLQNPRLVTADQNLDLSLHARRWIYYGAALLLDVE